MEPLAISKATIGLDQSDAVGVVPGVEGRIAPELFVALLAQTLPAATSVQMPGNLAISTDAGVVVSADKSLTELAGSIVSALAAASLAAQRGVQIAQDDAKSPALVTVNSADVTPVVTPALTVSVPTVDSEIDASPTLQLFVKPGTVNHDLISRVTLQQVKTVETKVVNDVTALNATVEAPAKVDAAIAATVVFEAPAEAALPDVPMVQPLGAVMSLPAEETYGPVLPAAHKVAITDEDPVVISVVTSQVVVPTDADPVPEYEDVLDNHITLKLEVKTDDPNTSVAAQRAMIAQLAPHVQIIEARIVAQPTDKVKADVDNEDEEQKGTIKPLVSYTPQDRQIFEIDPALAAQLIVQAPPANAVTENSASKPDLVQHRRATVQAPAVLLKQAEISRDITSQSAASTTLPAPTAQRNDEQSEPVITYTGRPAASNGDAASYDSNDAQQNEQCQDQRQKSNPTFTRANSASVKDDGMTVTTDTVLARVEGATKDIRDLARFNVRDVEVSLASAPKIETTTQATVATPDTTAQTMRTDTSSVEQTQTTSASDDTRGAAANDIRLRALERMVVTAAREGSDTIKMQLYPPGLGQVIIRLHMEGSRLRLSTRTSNAAATEALQKIEQSLRDELSMNGLDLTQFDVSEDHQERDRASRQQPEQHQPKRGSFSDEVFAIDMNA